MRRAVAFVGLLTAIAFAQTPRPQDAFAPVRSLLGEWIADSASGGGAGWFSFAPDLGGKVIVRKNHAENPPSSGRTAVHDDLMIIYPQGGALLADFYDSEGHVIHYAITSADEKSVMFISEPQPGAPRFRLIYQFTSVDTVKLVFDISPSGRDTDFKNYITATAHRKH